MKLIIGMEIGMKIGMKKVSVVVATYRRDQELRTALSSLAGQSYENLEIIVVDDNADAHWNKKVEAIFHDFRAMTRCTNIKLEVNKVNMGSAKTRNIGVSLATGDYITFLDDDDVYLPDKVSKQAALMDEGEYDYSITDLFLYNRNDVLIDKRVRNYIKNTDKESLVRYHLMHHLTGTDTLMFKKEYLEKIGGFGPANVGDEYYLIQKAIDGDGKFGYLPQCDVKAYIHTVEGGVSSGDGKIQGENALYEYKKKYFAYLDGKTKKYIRMRHYAVIAFAEIRRHNYASFIKNVVISFVCSPTQCVAMFYNNYIKR